jgi:hypothetical protein
MDGRPAPPAAALNSDCPKNVPFAAFAQVIVDRAAWL